MPGVAGGCRSVTPATVIPGGSTVAGDAAVVSGSVSSDGGGEVIGRCGRVGTAMAPGSGGVVIAGPDGRARTVKCGAVFADPEGRASIAPATGSAAVIGDSGAGGEGTVASTPGDSIEAKD